MINVEIHYHERNNSPQSSGSQEHPRQEGFRNAKQGSDIQRFTGKQ